MSLRLLPNNPALGLVPGRVVTFSSFPGQLSSGDDFYSLSSGLQVVETTIGNDNQTLYNDYFSPRCVYEFVRNLVANRLASSGQA